MSVHRFSYEAFVGSIPAGLTIDHLCNNPFGGWPGDTLDERKREAAESAAALPSPPGVAPEPAAGEGWSADGQPAGC